MARMPDHFDDFTGLGALVVPRKPPISPVGSRAATIWYQVTTSRAGGQK